MSGPRLSVYGYLRKLVMPAPVSNPNLCPAELFPPELGISVPPLVPEKGRLSLPPHSCPVYFASLLYKIVLPSHWRCFLHGAPLLSATRACSCSLLLVWSRIYYNINNVTCIQGLALPHASALCKSSASAPW